jgi:hypothetical protein
VGKLQPESLSWDCQTCQYFGADSMRILPVISPQPSEQELSATSERGDADSQALRETTRKRGVEKYENDPAEHAEPNALQHG